MSFFSALFGGSNPTLNSTIGKTGNISDISSSIGTNSTTQGSNFFSSLVSGDPTKIAQTLAPAISAGQKGVQQQKNQIAQFGNRSGGNTAKVASLDSANRGNIIDMVGKAQSGAASTLLSSGENLLGTALSGYGEQSQMSQQQMENWAKSIFGGGLKDFAQTGLNAAEGAIGL